jgi:hypothetical protein
LLGGFECRRHSHIVAGVAQRLDEKAARDHRTLIDHKHGIQPTRAGHLANLALAGVEAVAESDGQYPIPLSHRSAGFCTAL